MGHPAARPARASATTPWGSASPCSQINEGGLFLGSSQDKLRSGSREGWWGETSLAVFRSTLHLPPRLTGDGPPPRGRADEWRGGIKAGAVQEMVYPRSFAPSGISTGDAQKHGPVESAPGGARFRATMWVENFRKAAENPNPLQGAAAL